MLSITVVVDNESNPSRKDLISGWGLSLYVQYNDDHLLFDLGHDEYVFLNNLSLLGLDLGSVRHVVISHEHGDHTGGLGAIVELGKRVTLYLPSPSFLESRLSELVNVRVVKDVENILDDVYVVSFHNGVIPEQVLVFNKSFGLVVLVGCSHPGVFKIISTCVGLFKKDVHVLIGGLHLFRLNRRDLRLVVDRICRSSTVRFVCPLHCSGEEIKHELERACPEKLIYGRVGSVVKIDDLGNISVE